MYTRYVVHHLLQNKFALASKTHINRYRFCCKTFQNLQQPDLLQDRLNVGGKMRNTPTRHRDKNQKHKPMQ